MIVILSYVHYCEYITLSTCCAVFVVSSLCALLLTKPVLNNSFWSPSKFLILALVVLPCSGNMLLMCKVW
jgi:hypothetical protein